MSFGKTQKPKNTVKNTKENTNKPLGKENEVENKPRKINKKPYKILDAPNLQDDFYLNLLDWSDNNQIAVALDSSLYVWSGCSSEVSKLYETCQVNDYLCSVSFCEDNKVSIGNTLGQIKIFDLVKERKSVSLKDILEESGVYRGHLVYSLAGREMELLQHGI